MRDMYAGQAAGLSRNHQGKLCEAASTGPKGVHPGLVSRLSQRHRPMADIERESAILQALSAEWESWDRPGEGIVQFGADGLEWRKRA
jgi:hypothetical protein